MADVLFFYLTKEGVIVVFCTNCLMILICETLQVGEIKKELTAWLVALTSITVMTNL